MYLPEYPIGSVVYSKEQLAIAKAIKADQNRQHEKILADLNASTQGFRDAEDCERILTVTEERNA